LSAGTDLQLSQTGSEWYRAKKTDNRLQLLRIILFACLALITGTTFAADQKHIQLITWRGMTSAEQGFLSRLAEHGLQAKYDHFDAGRSETKLAGFLRANRSELEKRDLIYTFGTTATLTVKNFDMVGIPTVFNIVSDPIGSGITLSMEMPTGGITGQNCLCPQK
jgi:putative ABC transport system substrate-binding protein